MNIKLPQTENVSKCQMQKHNDKKIINELKGCNINWVDEPDNNTARVSLRFSAFKNKYSVAYSVVDASGKTIVASQKMYFKKVDGVGKELAMRIFGVGGAVEIE